MNITTFNDPINMLVPDFVQKTKSLENLQGSPLFLYEDTESDMSGNGDFIEKISSEKNLLPFPKMRISIKFASQIVVNPEITELRAWMIHTDGILEIITGIMFRDGFCLGLIKATSKGCVYNKKIPPIRNDGKKQSLLPEWVVERDCQVVFSAIVRFLREAMSPSSFIASCSPKKNGKSLDWIKGRTHYVVLHKTHPANNKAVAENQSIEVGSDYLKRQAHSRRAHTRILKNPRFRFKIGKTISVKACWCGPKEWQQNNSIYVMQDRLKPNV